MRIKYAFLALSLIVFAGCGKKSDDSMEPESPPAAQESVEQPAQPEVAPEQAQPAENLSESTRESGAVQPARTRQAPARRTQEKTAAVSQPEQAPRAVDQPQNVVRTVEKQEEVPEVAKVQTARIVTIPSGTAVQVRLAEGLDSSVNKTGDSFEAILDQDIEIDGLIVARRGSIAEGTLSNVEQSGRVEGRAAMSLKLINLVIEDQSYPLQTETLSYVAESTKKSDATKVGIGAGIGAVIGAIAGGGKGAAIGAAVGGGAGGATVLATRGKEIVFEPEQKFGFVLSEDIAVNLR